MTDEGKNKAIFTALGWRRHKIDKSSDGVDIYESLWLLGDPPFTNEYIQGPNCKLGWPDYISNPKPHDQT